MDGKNKKKSHGNLGGGSQRSQARRNSVASILHPFGHLQQQQAVRPNVRPQGQGAVHAPPRGAAIGLGGAVGRGIPAVRGVGSPSVQHMAPVGRAAPPQMRPPMMGGPPAGMMQGMPPGMGRGTGSMLPRIQAQMMQRAPIYGHGSRPQGNQPMHGPQSVAAQQTPVENSPTIGGPNNGIGISDNDLSSFENVNYNFEGLKTSYVNKPSKF